MKFDERKGIKKGLMIVLIPLFFLLLIVLTLNFPDLFLEYSGVLTFYSLLIAISIFFISEMIKRFKEREEDVSLLRNLDEERKAIERQLDFFDGLRRGNPPVHNMIPFNDVYLSDLPYEINSISTSRLKRLIFFANDKIDTLNGIRDKIWDLVWDKSDKEIKTFSKKPIINDALNEVDKAINNLKNTLKLIETNLKLWEIF